MSWSTILSIIVTILGLTACGNNEVEQRPLLICQSGTCEALSGSSNAPAKLNVLEATEITFIITVGNDGPVTFESIDSVEGSLEIVSSTCDKTLENNETCSITAKATPIYSGDYRERLRLYHWWKSEKGEMILAALYIPIDAKIIARGDHNRDGRVDLSDLGFLNRLDKEKVTQRMLDDTNRDFGIGPRRESEIAPTGWVRVTE